MNHERVKAVADALAAIGYDGITTFDEAEPEYDTFQTLYDTYGDETYVKLLAICATTQDYQLNGDAQRFWRELTRVALAHGSLTSSLDVKQILGTFMKADVNARLNQQKRDRLIRIFEAKFDSWFVANHADAKAVTVWERLAAALDTTMEKKTVVLAMKVYDIAHLIKHGVYLEFPRDIPIPCDLQVERVSHTSGVTASEDPDEIMATWAAVMERVSGQVGRHVSLLRIDSIVWQAGQIIGANDERESTAREALADHFESVGVNMSAGETLAKELTAMM